MSAVIIIPARLESTRLPGKLLLRDTGKMLIQHTWERARESDMDVVIATDSQAICSEAGLFGADCVMTGEHENGTLRTLDAVEQLERLGRNYDRVINLQADEPDVWLFSLRQLRDTDYPICSCAYPTDNIDQANCSDNTKVVMNGNGKAGYFSRSRIPSEAPKGQSVWWIHVGVYSFARQTLEEIGTLSPSPWERSEQLEQLRWLWHGHDIWILPTRTTLAINTENDYKAFKAWTDERTKEPAQG